MVGATRITVIMVIRFITAAMDILIITIISLIMVATIHIIEEEEIRVTTGQKPVADPMMLASEIPHIAVLKPYEGLIEIMSAQMIAETFDPIRTVPYEAPIQETVPFGTVQTRGTTVPFGATAPTTLGTVRSGTIVTTTLGTTVPSEVGPIEAPEAAPILRPHEAQTTVPLEVPAEAAIDQAVGAVEVKT